MQWVHKQRNEREQHLADVQCGIDEIHTMLIMKDPDEKKASKLANGL